MILALIYKISTFAAVAYQAECDPTTDNPSQPFLGFPHWWKYIHKGSGDLFGRCSPEITFPNGLFSIIFAVVDMLLYLAGIAAVVSIIIAGISYITSVGSPDKITSARRRIVNSLIGLAIILIAGEVVSFIGTKLG
jgi:hypothetical protein